MKLKKLLIVVLTVAVLFCLYAFIKKSSWFSENDTETIQQTTNQTEKSTPTPEQPANKTPAFDKNQYSLSDPTSIWLIVNKTRPFSPLTYTPTDLVSVGGGQLLRKEAADQFLQLLQAASSASQVISPLSGYRSYSTQVSVYNNEVATNGQDVADTQSARPGTSEHQSGWAIDVGGGGCGIEDCFGSTQQGKWLAENAYKFGFIIRYPEGKQPITGYRTEPWHIRYVGVDLATEMKNQNITTLEEFFGTGPAPNYP